MGRVRWALARLLQEEGWAPVGGRKGFHPVPATCLLSSWALLGPEEAGGSQSRVAPLVERGSCVLWTHPSTSLEHTLGKKDANVSLTVYHPISPDDVQPKQSSFSDIPVFP